MVFSHNDRKVTKTEFKGEKNYFVSPKPKGPQ